MSKSSAKYNGVYVCKNCAKKLAANNILLIKLKKYPLEELQRIVGAEDQKQEEHQEEVDRVDEEVDTDVKYVVTRPEARRGS